MILYLDTSALVKLYVDEADADLVAAWLAEVEFVATSRIAFAEAVAAFARRAREGDLSAPDLGKVLAALRADWEQIAVLEVDEQLAGELAQQHALRGMDAIHLAAALELQRASDTAMVAFGSFDHRQREAAGAEGLEVLG